MKYIISFVFIIAVLFPFDSAAAENGETIEFTDAAFTLLTEEGSRSELNAYVHPNLKTFERNGKAHAWLEWTYPELLVNLHVKEQGQQIEPEVIVSTNKRHVVELQMEPASLLEIELKQENQPDPKKYIVQIQMEENEELPAFKVPAESKAISSMPRRTEIAIPPAAEQKKEAVKTEELKPEKEQKPAEQPSLSELEEKRLTFDRSVDAPRETPPPVKAAAPVEQPQQQFAAAADRDTVLTLDLLKVWGLFALCAASGILLLRRIFSSKKAVK